MSEELKPCPFCGGEAMWDTGGAHCASIDCRGHVIKGFTAEEWNARPAPAVQVPVAMWVHTCEARAPKDRIITLSAKVCPQCGKSAPLAAAPAPATVATEPVAQGGGVDVYKLQQQADAWQAVVKVLTEIDPWWTQREKRGVDAAVATIRALLSASTAGVGGWQPIETAPKHGWVEVLVRGDSGCAVAYFDPDEGEWLTDYRGKGNWQYVHAMYWMPLPAAPAIAKQGEGE